METDQAQRATHHIASNDHDLLERTEKDDSVNHSQEDVNQLEYDVKEKKKDEHSRQFPGNLREVNKDDPEKVVQQQKDLDLGQTVEVTVDMQVVNKEDPEKDARGQMDQNSEETPGGNEEVKDVNKDNTEKDAREQMAHNSEETPAGNEGPQSVYKSDPERNSRERNSGQNAAGNEDAQDVNKSDSTEGNEKIDQVENGNVKSFGLLQGVNSLRKDVQKWLELHQFFGRDDVSLAIKELVDLRPKYNASPQLWQKEVISIRDVQERLNWIIEYMKITPDEKQRYELLGSSEKS